MNNLCICVFIKENSCLWLNHYENIFLFEFLLGCHTGHVTFYVAEHFQPAQIVGLDIDQQLIQQAQNQLTNRIQQTTNTTAESKRYPYNLRFQQVWIEDFLFHSLFLNSLSLSRLCSIGSSNSIFSIMKIELFDQIEYSRYICRAIEWTLDWVQATNAFYWSSWAEASTSVSSHESDRHIFQLFLISSTMVMKTSLLNRWTLDKRSIQILTHTERERTRKKNR